jgi:hypothetical protein
MAKSANAMAKKMLAGGESDLEELRIHEFADDDSAHDNEAIEKLYETFSSHFDRVREELTKQYGEPSRIGNEDDDAIPLNGVFRFAIWTVNEAQLFAAAAHENRETPIVLMLGIVE